MLFFAYVLPTEGLKIFTEREARSFVSRQAKNNFQRNRAKKICHVFRN